MPLSSYLVRVLDRHRAAAAAIAAGPPMGPGSTGIGPFAPGGAQAFGPDARGLVTFRKDRVLANDRHRSAAAAPGAIAAGAPDPTAGASFTPGAPPAGGLHSQAADPFGPDAPSAQE